MRLTKTLTAPAAALTLSACIGGTVHDAETGSPIEGARVTAHASCVEGGACAAGNTQLQRTTADGRFVFDATGDYYESYAQMQRLLPLPGDEAIRLVVSHPGYVSRTVWVRQDVDAFLRYENPPDDVDPADVEPPVVTTRVFLCVEGAPDTDGDSICDAAEARYGTNPNRRDTDGDALSDDVELFGAPNVDLKFYGADPRHKDLFVELDYYANLGGKGSAAYVPKAEDFDRAKDGFARAPIANPDGFQGIRLHVVVDEAVQGKDVISGTLAELFESRDAHFDPRRLGLFRYALLADRSADPAGGRTYVNADALVLYWGHSTDLPRSLMHELGHGMGLEHGGHEAQDDKPNYMSIMNQRYRTVRYDGVNRLDFSRVAVSGLVESSLSETDAFGPLDDTTEADLAHYSVWGCNRWLNGNASRNLDYNRNGVIESQVSVDLNCNSSLPQRTWWDRAQNDWKVIGFTAGGRIGRPRAGMRAQPDGDVISCD